MIGNTAGESDERNGGKPRKPANSPAEMKDNELRLSLIK